MSLDLAALGFTKENLQQRVIDQICEQLLSRETGDEDGRSWFGESDFKKELDKLIKQRIDAKVTEIADKHVLPKVDAIIEGFVLQETTSWGEKKGRSFTFTEYLVSRAEHYMNEDVNFSGETKEKAGYNWSKETNRMTWCINRMLATYMQNAMKQCLRDMDAKVNGGLMAAAQASMVEAAKSIRLKVELAK